MAIADHLIFSAYGLWLPNDPRGSWSDFVRAWELLRFGEATKAQTHRSGARVSHDRALRRDARDSWDVFLDTSEDVWRAIDYVNRNPLREGKKAQTWSFVEKFPG